MKFSKKAKKEFRQKSVYLGAIILLILVILILKIDVVQIITILTLIVLASFSKIYKRVTSISLGFELVTPTTLFFAYKIGIVFTIVAAFIMLLASAFIASKLKFPELLVQLGVYAIIAVIISIFSSVSFIPLAIAVIILRIILLTIFEVVLLGSNFIEVAIYLFGNTFFNIIIVTTLSSFVLEML